MYKKDTLRWLKHLDFILLDIISMEIAFFIAFVIRNGMEPPARVDIYYEMALLLILIDVACCLILDSFKNVLRRGKMNELLSILQQAFVTEGVLLFYFFLTKRGAMHSRIVFGLLPVFYICVSFVLRLGLKHIVRNKKGNKYYKSVYIVTTEDRALQAIRDIESTNFGTYMIAGLTLLDKKAVGRKFGQVEVVADEDDLLEYLCRNWVDEVYVSVDESKDVADELIEKIIEMGIVVHIEIARWKSVNGRKQFTEKIGQAAVLTTSINTATTVQIFCKRTFDILIGLVGCLFTLLLIVILGPIIYIKSPGNIFFSQERVGRNGKIFKIYKFRSMYLDAEKRKAELMKQNKMSNELMFKLDYDPRIIGCKKLPDGTIKKGIGNYIRDLSLDEFPQFLNVLKGDMSMIGTRPPTKDEWLKYDLHHRARLAMKPGITGMWQVSGRSNITDFEEVVKLDRKYITEWSLALDMRIFFKTIKVVLKKEGAV